MRDKSGFTLVELLVAISITAIIAFTGFKTFSNHIAKSRDTVRKEDIKAIRGALIGIMASEGSYPSNDTVIAKLRESSGKTFHDPIDGARKCKAHSGITNNNARVICEYTYLLCDDGASYALQSRFETEKYIIESCPAPPPSTSGRRRVVIPGVTTPITLR